MTDEKAPKPTTEQLLAELNKQTSQRLHQRTSSFFFPESNGPDDLYGLNAFHAGDLGPIDQFAGTALAQTTAENIPKKSTPQTDERIYITNVQGHLVESSINSSGVIYKDPTPPVIQSHRRTREDKINELLRERERIEKRLRELSHGNVGKKTGEERKLLYGRLKQINRNLA